MATLSRWELGDLLGVHPHLLERGERHIRLVDLPVRIIIELAARLDVHPADLVPELDTVLTNQRQPTQPGTPDDTEPGHEPGDGPTANTVAADAPDLLAALAHGGIPLSIDELATALGWAPERAAAAVKHARTHPQLGGPMVLDRLTPEQHETLASVQPQRAAITPEEATLLLAALSARGLGTTPSSGADSSSRSRHSRSPGCCASATTTSALRSHRT